MTEPLVVHWTSPADTAASPEESLITDITGGHCPQAMSSEKIPENLKSVYALGGQSILGTIAHDTQYLLAIEKQCEHFHGKTLKIFGFSSLEKDMREESAKFTLLLSLYRPLSRF